MKWFKHYSNARISNALTEILAIHGPKGYGRYWLLLELMCEKFDGENDTKFIFDTAHLKQTCGFHRNQDLIKFLSSLNQVGIMSHTSRNQVIEINTDILLRLQGRDYKRSSGKRGQSAPKKETKNKTKKKNKNKTICAEIAPAEKNKFTIKIIEHWNSEKIIIHKVSDKLILDVAKLIKAKKLSASDILKAIENYKFILSNENFIWTHKWSLKEFLKRENAEKFYPEEFNLDRFPRKQSSKAKEKQDNMLSMRNPYAK